MAETTLNKKMRAFDDEVALTVAQFYLVHMLQRTLPAGFIAQCLPTKTDKLPSTGERRSLVRSGRPWATHGRLNPTERTMRKIRNALLSILTVMSGAILAVPTEAAERYIPGVYKGVP